MRTGRQAFVAVAILTAVLLAVVAIREVFFGYTAYFLLVPGATGSMDGKPAEGWLHRGGKGHLLIVTREVAGRRDSYWIRRPDERSWQVLHCGDWSAPRCPLIAVGDVNPPCLSSAFLQIPGSDVPGRTPGCDASAIVFAANDGERSAVSW
jgi:hypothetical protein